MTTNLGNESDSESNGGNVLGLLAQQLGGKGSPDAESSSENEKSESDDSDCDGSESEKLSEGQASRGSQCLRLSGVSATLNVTTTISARLSFEGQTDEVIVKQHQ